MNKKPVIGISSSISIDKDNFFLGYEYASVSFGCVNSIKRAGAVPFVLPAIEEDPEVIKAMVSNVDAIMLSGGHDVNPLLWGEEPHKDLSEISTQRDAFDYNLIKYAREQGKPILGICRGYQIMNVFFGGTLWQDISKIPEFYIKHNQKAKTSEVTHSVLIEKDSCLYPILGEKVLVNSYHHMAIKEPAPNFKVMAKAPDGVIEMIEDRRKNFMLGVQWHPEMLSEKDKAMQEIFNYFVNQCKN